MERNQTPRWLAYSVPLQRLFVRIGVLPFLLKRIPIILKRSLHA